MGKGSSRSFSFRDTPRTEKAPLRIVKYRETPPAHFNWKIQQFSFYSGLDLIDSPVFERDGYKWKLILYPNGNKNENGERFFSLYLRLADTSSLQPGWEVKAFFRLFLFNHVTGKYLTVEDTEERRFHANKKEWGLSHFISVKHLSLGYLFNDSCVFGAEVSVINNTGQCGFHSLKKVAPPSIIEWKFQNILKLKKTTQSSDVFTAGDYKWKIKLNTNYSTGNVSLALTLSDTTTLVPGECVPVDYSLGIKNHRDGSINYYPAKSWFSASNTSWGIDYYMPFYKLKDKKKGFLVNDSCVVVAKITVLKVTNTE